MSQHREKVPRHRVLKAVGITMATVLVVVIGVGVLIYRHLSGNITGVDMNSALGTSRPSEIAEPNKPHKAMNILLIGSDTRQGQKGHFGIVAGARSDTTILMHINADRTLAYGISIPRDSMVQRPACTMADGSVDPAGLDMFNAAFSIGGPTCTVKTVEALTHIRIDHFVEVDFNGFRGMVDAIGGVEVCLPYAVNDDVGHITLPAGTHTFDGFQSLQYVRERHAFSGGSDIGRTYRQQAFLASMANKVISAGTLLNPIRLYKFLDAATKSLTTDTGLNSVAKLASFAEQVKGIDRKNIQFMTVPTGAYPPNPNRVEWLPSANKIWYRIRFDERLSRAFRDQVTTAAAQSKPGSGAAPNKHLTPQEAAARAQQAHNNGLCA
ncbi:MAG: LCP family protein [Nocardioidaceae bacterium]